MANHVSVIKGSKRSVPEVIELLSVSDNPEASSQKCESVKKRFLSRFMAEKTEVSTKVIIPVRDDNSGIKHQDIHNAANSPIQYPPQLPVGFYPPDLGSVAYHSMLMHEYQQFYQRFVLQSTSQTHHSTLNFAGNLPLHNNCNTYTQQPYSPYIFGTPPPQLTPPPLSAPSSQAPTSIDHRQLHQHPLQQQQQQHLNQKQDQDQNPYYSEQKQQQQQLQQPQQNSNSNHHLQQQSQNHHQQPNPSPSLSLYSDSYSHHQQQHPQTPYSPNTQLVNSSEVPKKVPSSAVSASKPQKQQQRRRSQNSNNVLARPKYFEDPSISVPSWLINKNLPNNSNISSNDDFRSNEAPTNNSSPLVTKDLKQESSVKNSTKKKTSKTDNSKASVGGTKISSKTFIPPRVSTSTNKSKLIELETTVSSNKNAQHENAISNSTLPHDKKKPVMIVSSADPLLSNTTITIEQAPILSPIKLFEKTMKYSDEQNNREPEQRPAKPDKCLKVSEQQNFNSQVNLADKYCATCVRSFEDEYSFKLHLKYIHNNNPKTIVCRLGCQFTASTLDKFKEHCTKYHRSYQEYLKYVDFKPATTPKSNRSSSK